MSYVHAPFLDFSHWLIQILPLLELAMVEAIASCEASVTTDTSKGEVQSEKKNHMKI